MTLSEADIKKQIRDVLTACRIFHYAGGILFSKKGTADIIGVIPPEGRALAIEVKREGWAPPNPGTKAYKHYCEQRDFLNSVRDHGGIGFFAQSVEEVIERLDLKVKLYPLFAGEQSKC